MPTGSRTETYAALASHKRKEAKHMLETKGLVRFGEEWVETEPLVFRQLDGPNWLVFREDEDGAIRDALRGIGGHSVLVRGLQVEFQLSRVFLL